MSEQLLPVVRWARDAAPLLEQVSPELALVDPVLRRKLLEQAAKEGLHRPLPVAARRMVDDPAPQSEPEEHLPVQRSRRPRARILVLGAALIVLFALGALVSSSRVLHTGRSNASARGIPVAARPDTVPSAAKTPSTSTVPHQTTAATSTPAPQPRTPPSSVRRLVWVPAAGAGAYEVALYRGNVRVFHTRTATPAVSITVSSNGSGKPRSVAPGTYEWYVWPVLDGQRRAAAIVRSQLALTAS